MCGIVGAYGFVDEGLIKDMADAISHRGPDGEGFYFGRKGMLGVRRLAIIDLKTGQMPISNEDGNVWIVYNGEIYNHEELAEELKERGHVYKTKSDTETVLHAYEEWGYDCVKRFNGMFAFAIYEGGKDEIFLARDQFGIKPLYYYQDGERLLFSSEIKALTLYENFESGADERAIFEYLAFRKHDHRRETFFSGVRRLLPSEYAIVSDKGIRVQRYYILRIDSLKQSTEEELVEKFRGLFIKAVNDRLMSEVPVGTCLSGGLDSSSIVCSIFKLLKEKRADTAVIGDIQKTFSAIFPGQINDEEPYIKNVLDGTKSGSYFVYPSGGDFFEELDEFVYFQEEPFISSGPYSQWCVMRAASGRVKVLLDGQGADEILAGYTPYFLVYLKQLLKERKFLKFLRELVFSLPVVRGIIYDKVKLTMRRVPSSKSLLSKEFAGQFLNIKTEVVTDNLKERLRNDLFTDSVPALLRYEDKNSMAFSIEGRVPFLDTKLVEFIFSLPDDMVIKNGRSKHILREALRDILPEKIVNRNWKVGFTTPEVAWFRENKEKIMEIINSESFKSRKYFDYKKVLTFAENFFKGKHDESMVIWRLINLEIWLRIFID